MSTEGSNRRARIRVFWWVLVASGLLYAVVVARSAWTHRWWISLLRLGGAGAVFGAAIGLIVLLEGYDLPKTLLRLLGAPALAIGLYIGLQSLPTGIWKQLPDPPQPLETVQIVDAYRTFSVGVTGRSADGTEWQLRGDGSGEVLWVRSGAAVAGGARINNCAARYSTIAAARPPGRVIDSDDDMACGPDYAIWYSVALLDDGGVWFWSANDSALDATWRELGIVLVAVMCGILAPYAPRWLNALDARKAR